MSISARLLVHPPSSGSWNMAVDQSLLDHCQSQPVLRFYRWSEPTLTLGYFQKHQQRNGHQASSNCPLLRRSTGGGAIVHDLELTYSLQVPIALVPHRSADLYDVVHDSFCQWLTTNGVDARPYSPTCIVAPEEIDQKAFLCFQRRADGDVVGWTEDAVNPVEAGTCAAPKLTAGAKLLGSAQRKQKNALLQHGSILLRRSDCAPELPGVMDLATYTGPRELDIVVDSISKHLQDDLAAKLSWEFQVSQLSQLERDTAQDWQAKRFNNSTWNHSR